MTDTTTSPGPLTPEREQEIRQGQPGDWLPGPWTIREIEGTAAEPSRWELVHHGSGKVLATLPDWAGNVALWAADAHDAVLELLAELDRARGALREVLGIVTDWCVEANDCGGVDATDLAFRLEQAGHPLPDEEPDR